MLYYQQFLAKNLLGTSGVIWIRPCSQSSSTQLAQRERFYVFAISMRVYQMINNRPGEQGPIPGRSERIFQKQEYFYYRTREGIDIGPFDTEADAIRGVQDFVNFLLDDPHSAETLSYYSGKKVAWGLTEK